jgi:hypothetical protein
MWWGNVVVAVLALVVVLRVQSGAWFQQLKWRWKSR